MKIAIVRLSALGDIVQSMIVIQFIKKNFPIAEIDWFVEEKFAKVLELNNDIHKTYKVNLSKKNILGFFLEIYRLKRKYKKLDEYDLTVDLQGLIKSAIVSKIIPSKKIFGFDKHSCREGLAAYLYSSSYYVDYDHNVIKRYIELTAWSLNISSSTFDIYDKKKIIQENDADISKPRYGLFVIGASFSSKQYSIENFAIVAKSLNIDIIVLWGSQSEKELAENLSLSSKNITVSEKLNLIELVKLINLVLIYTTLVLFLISEEIV